LRRHAELRSAHGQGTRRFLRRLLRVEARGRVEAVRRCVSCVAEILVAGAEPALGFRLVLHHDASFP
jgi:hypothetical protein